MNNIPERQNEDRNLELLAAQRLLYSKSKKLLGASILLSAPFAIIWAAITTCQPEAKPLAAAWGITISLLDFFYFSRHQKRLRKEAAAIQEKFDCEVLELEWKALKTGTPPSPESISEAATAYQRKHFDYEQLKNWYPMQVGKLPIEIARLLCQRANCMWDMRLRQRYAAATIALAVLVAAAAFGIGLAGGLTLDKLIVGIIVPLAPVFFISLKQSTEQREAATTGDRLVRHADALIAKVRKGSPTAKELTKDARELQDEIFDYRRSSPPIFDWAYRHLQPTQELQMNKAATELTNEIITLKKQ